VKPYILVSLWADDDDATRASHAFALGFHALHGAARFVHGEAPSHDDLRMAAEACPDAAVVIFAHGGPALSPRSGGVAWIGARDLAEILSGRRVYAFACSTFVPHRLLFFSTFASLAVDACVGVFAGHEAPVMTPSFADEARRDRTRRTMEDALSRLIERFIEGEDDEGELVNVGRMYATWDLEVEIDLPSEDPYREGAFGWSSGAFLGGFFKSLRVRTKAHAAQAERAEVESLHGRVEPE
jgi:hypothetical protein